MAFKVNLIYFYRHVNLKILDFVIDISYFFYNYFGTALDLLPGQATHRLLCMDAQALALINESFDLALSVHTIEHISEIGMAISDFERILKPCGYIMRSNLFLGFIPTYISVLRKKCKDEQEDISPF